MYENDTILYVGKHYEEAVDRTEDMGNAVVMPDLLISMLLEILTMILFTWKYTRMYAKPEPSEEYLTRSI